jgi:hypothetical protein
MDLMSYYLVMATIEARVASAQERRDGRRLEKERRAERRRRRRIALAGWWQGWVSNGPEIGSWRLLAAAPARALPPSVELAQVLDEAAHRIAELGSGAERRLLDAMAEVAAQSAPGAAAALGDPEGSEASRLRAFGLLHGHLLDALGEREHAWLLDLLDEPDGLDSPGRVA